MALPQILQVDREQAITDLIEAVALQEAAVASLIFAEAAKVDALVAATIPAAGSIQEVESYQAAVAGVIQIATQRAQSTTEKLEALRGIVGKDQES